MRSRIAIATLGATAALALGIVPGATAATNIHRATLDGAKAYPAAHGSAKFSVDDGVRQLEAEVQDLKALAGKRVRFIVNGSLVAADRVNSLGTARIDKSGGVPNVTTGSRIRVKRPSGVLVARGRFS